MKSICRIFLFLITTMSWYNPALLTAQKKRRNLGDSIHTRAHHKTLTTGCNIPKKNKDNGKTNFAPNVVAPTDTSRDLPSCLKIQNKPSAIVTHNRITIYP